MRNQITIHRHNGRWCIGMDERAYNSLHLLLQLYTKRIPMDSITLEQILVDTIELQCATETALREGRFP